MLLVTPSGIQQPSRRQQEHLGIYWFMDPMDTEQTVDQTTEATRFTDPSRPDKGLASSTVRQCAAGLQQLQHIAAAQHLDELSGLTPGQITDITCACGSLMITSDYRIAADSTDPAAYSWGSEQQQQLELLLNAASNVNALSLYIEADTPQQAVPVYPVLTSLLELVSDTLQELFQGFHHGYISMMDSL
jgi:hypothetical protein